LRDDAFLMAVNIAKLHTAADIEGHSKAAELGQPGWLRQRHIGRYA
jgi:hypothetical protein